MAASRLTLTTDESSGVARLAECLRGVVAEIEHLTNDKPSQENQQVSDSILRLNDSINSLQREVKGVNVKVDGLLGLSPRVKKLDESMGEFTGTLNLINRKLRKLCTKVDRLIATSDGVEDIANEISSSVNTLVRNGGIPSPVRKNASPTKNANRIGPVLHTPLGSSRSGSLSGATTPALLSRRSNVSRTIPQTFEFREVVLAKVPAMQNWPGMIVDPKTISQDVLLDRPENATAFYCVKLFAESTYWVHAKDISKLESYEIEKFIRERKGCATELVKGYRLALGQKESEKKTADNDTGQSSQVIDVDKLDGDDDEEEVLVLKTNKRKRITREDVLSTDEESSSSGEDEEDGDDDDDDEEIADIIESMSSSPPNKKAKLDEKRDVTKPWDYKGLNTLRLRKELQDLSRGLSECLDQKDMPKADGIFTQIEKFIQMNPSENFEKNHPETATVMRNIAASDADEFSGGTIRNRAKELIIKWSLISPPS